MLGISQKPVYQRWCSPVGECTRMQNPRQESPLLYRQGTSVKAPLHRDLDTIFTVHRLLSTQIRLVFTIVRRARFHRFLSFGTSNDTSSGPRRRRTRRLPCPKQGISSTCRTEQQHQSEQERQTTKAGSKITRKTPRTPPYGCREVAVIPPLAQRRREQFLAGALSEGSTASQFGTNA